MKFLVSFRGTLQDDSRERKDDGAMVFAGDELFFVPINPNSGLDEIMNAEFAGMMGDQFTAKEVFDYNIQTANGITITYSKPETFNARDRVELTERVRARLLKGG